MTCSSYGGISFFYKNKSNPVSRAKCKCLLLLVISNISVRQEIMMEPIVSDNELASHLIRMGGTL